MNELERFAYDIKAYIEDCKNIYGIPLSAIEYVKSCIKETFEWIKNNRNACKEDYEEKKKKLNDCLKDINEWSNIYKKNNVNMNDNDLKKKKIHLLNNKSTPKEKSINNESKKIRIKSMNSLVKQVYRFKEHIEDKKIIYRIPPYYIKKINDNITYMILWIKYNQNARKEDYEKMNNELEKINYHLKCLYYKHYVVFKENESSECIDNLIKCAIDFKTYIENKKNIYVIPPDDIKNVKDFIINRNELIKNNQNIYNEDYEIKKIELRKIYDNLEISFNHYENEEKERINCMNNLLKCAYYTYYFNVYIKKENNIYKISQNIIKNVNDGIADRIERINNSQNSNKEDYKKKEKKLKEIFNNLKIYYNYYENKEKKGKDCMNNLVDYTNYFTKTIKWIKDNQNARKEDYETMKNELEKTNKSLKDLYYNHYIYFEENERSECMDNLVKCAIDFKTYIENKKNIYVIQLDDIKNLKDSIINRNELIINYQNIYNENYEKKKIELREILNKLEILYNHLCHYENKEKEKIDCMKNLIKCAEDFTDMIVWIKNNQNANKEDFEKKENELSKTFNNLQLLFNNYEKKEKKKIECMNVMEYEILKIQ